LYIYCSKSSCNICGTRHSICTYILIFPLIIYAIYYMRTSHVICLALLHYHFVRNRDIRICACYPIDTRFVAWDPVSFECWFAWLHQSRVIILSSYVSLHTEVTSVVRDIGIPNQIKIANYVQEWWEITPARRCSFYLVLFIVYHKEIGWKIMKHDTLNIHDRSWWQTVLKVWYKYYVITILFCI